MQRAHSLWNHGLLIGSSLSSITAFASGPYVGLNYSQYELESDATGNTLKPTGATVRAGIEFNDIFGLEARIGTGIEADARSSGLGTAEFELDRIYGGHL